MIVQEVIKPYFGAGILFRADKVHHSAELVHTVKRAITLFINIKKADLSPEELDEAKIVEPPVIRNVDMPDEMQADAIGFTKTALEQFKQDSDIADYIKTEFDNKHGGDWHCIVGKSYGSSITPLDGSFIYFSY